MADPETGPDTVLALASRAPGFAALRAHHPDQAAAGIDRLRDAAARQGREALGAALDTDAGRTFFSFLCGNSPHLSLLLQRDPEFTESLVTEAPDVLADRVRSELAGADAAMDRDDLMTFLRRRRNRVAVMAAAYDCFGISGVMDCAELLSDMADHAVRLTARHLLLDRVRRGDLEAPDGERWGYFVLAMGKHGSRELNYSSDIDLIVMYDPEAVRYTGRRTMSDCFVRVTQDLVRILQTRTGHGYVFRTDLRLRPDPSSTPVAITVDFALDYYDRFGRTWERTALIKARPVAGDLTAGAAFLERLSPFIWDEALDFTSVEEIRSMSQQIHDFHGHGAVKAPGHNVKLGRGGIREIEFFVHMHQLAYGGRNRRLRGPRLLAMLETLDRQHHIMPRETAALRDSYLWLRQVEHRLQMINDAQTQKLPESDDGMAHIAAFLGLDSAAELAGRVERIAGEVHDLYRARFNVPESEQDITAAILEGPDENPDAVAKLEAAGFTQALTAITTFRGWAEGRHASTGSERARTIIREILHEIVDAVGKTPDPDRALARMDRFLANLPEDISFFSMLRANTWLLNLIAVVMGSAPRMADILGANPRLLQAVLDPSFFLPLPGRERLAQDLDERLQGRRDAAERAEQVTAWAGDRRFQVGVQALQNLVTVDEASTSLSDVAAVAIDVLFRDAISRLQERHGPAPGGGCAVVALGKLGAGEMTFESDLDLLFVTGGEAAAQTDGPEPIDAGSFYRRAAGELFANLLRSSAYGRLYQVDERRPLSGGEPEVITLDEWRDRYAAAPDPELMALTRAGVLCGDTPAAEAVAAAITGALTRSREPEPLLQAAAGRRAAAAAAHRSGDPFDLQHARGGLTDLEACAQYLQLRHAHESPQVLARATAACFEALGSAGILTDDEARTLAAAVRMQRTLQAMLRLTWSRSAPVSDAPEALRMKLAAALECEGFAALEEKLRRTQEAALAIAERHAGSPAPPAG